MTRRIWLGAVLVIVLMVALWFAVFWSRIGDDLADERDRRDDAEAAVVQAQSERDRLAAAARDIPPLQSQLADLETAIPPEPQLAELVLQVADAGNMSGLDLARVVPGDPAASGQGLTEIPVELQVRGGYFQILDFVNRISVEPRVFVIDLIDLDALGDETAAGPPELEGVLVGRVFTTRPADDIVIVDRTGSSTGSVTTTTSSTTVPTGGADQ